MNHNVGRLQFSTSSPDSLWGVWRPRGGESSLGIGQTGLPVKEAFARCLVARSELQHSVTRGQIILQPFHLPLSGLLREEHGNFWRL